MSMSSYFPVITLDITLFDAVRDIKL